MNRADDNQLVMTQEGLDALKAELHKLRTKTRYEVAERIKVARGYGDLSENSEYDEAKEQQGFVEGKIAEIEEKVKRAVVVSDEDISTDDVSVGSYVNVLDMDYDEEVEYKIVGSSESDLLQNKLSNQSPVGMKLLGAKVNDIVKVEIPDGEAKYKVLSIRR